jgi:purine-binding chemotaxis protein CheW
MALGGRRHNWSRQESFQVTMENQNVDAASLGRKGGTAHSTSDELGKQYLTFVCDAQEYGVEILRVQEIKGWDNVTRVPHSPNYILGVMNLRGTIVPVVDLRCRFGLPARPFDTSTVVIVVRVTRGTGSEGTVGLVVDAVSDVHNFSANSVRPPPELGASLEQAFVNGIATAEEKLVMLLDIDKLAGDAVPSARSADA